MLHLKHVVVRKCCSINSFSIRNALNILIYALTISMDYRSSIKGRKYLNKRVNVCEVQTWSMTLFVLNSVRKFEQSLIKKQR
jgi:hypothetical protein